jgi:hypothetical protein
LEISSTWKPVSFGSEVSRELTDEVGFWQLEVSPARKLAVEEVLTEASGKSMRLA